MEYRTLGRSGLQVSRVCLGANMFGERTSAAVAARIVASALDSGVNFIDTADNYGDVMGDSERIVGRLIAKRRDYWVIATKFSTKLDQQDPNSGGLSRRWMMQALHGSLERLGTDYVDVYYLHHEDAQTPVEETVGAMGDLIRSGKVRYFGLSNFHGWRTAEVVAACDRLGVPRPIVSQPYYHALYRLAEVEILPACAHYGLGVVPYSPLARGVLTGKYAPGKKPPADSRGGLGDFRFMASEYRPESLAIAQALNAELEKSGRKLAHFAINWVLNNALVTSLLAGPRTYEQWLEYLAALEQPFDAADEALMESLVPSGHSSTPGHTDPKMPVDGRVLRVA